MEGKQNNNRQAQQFDKIFRENMSSAFNSIESHLLKLDIVSTEELPDRLQHTKERHPDLLKKIVASTGKKYVLHVEYQSTNDNEMVYRMAEYSIMLQREYRIQVKQFVIFIGNGKVSMIPAIVNEDFSFKYNLLSFSDINYKLFLNYSKPEEILLAILCNFEGDDEQTAVNNIVNKLGSTDYSALDKERYFTQLRVLVELRNLQTQLTKAMESISTFFKEEDDVLYRIGLDKGIVKGKIEVSLEIAREMAKNNIPIELITKITKLSVQEIENG